MVFVFTWTSYSNLIEGLQPPELFQTSKPPLPQDYILITASFGRILSTSTLSLFQQGRKLNVHPSLLPKYRGAAPIQWTILGGDDETGVCVIEMLGRKEGEGVDGGALWGMERLVSEVSSLYIWVNGECWYVSMISRRRIILISRVWETCWV